MRAFALFPIVTAAVAQGCAPVAPTPTFIQPYQGSAAAQPGADPYGQPPPPTNTWGADPYGQPQPGAPPYGQPQANTWGAAPQPQPQPPPVAAPVASTFRLDVPANFRSDSGWYINEQVEDRGDIRRITRGLVRVLPAVPASNANFNDVLRNQVKTYVPQELQASMSGLTYRRYVGDGLVAQYIQGQGIERGRKGNSWFVTYLIDCGATWQPLIVAATYDEHPPGAGFEMNIGFALPTAMNAVEPLLASVRCEGTKNQTIVDPATLAGHYYFGSGAAMDYVHVFTGASSTQYVSYAGEYDLRSNGTVTYRYSSAGNLGAGTTFAGDTGVGKWTIERDMLIIALNGRKPKALRIAALQNVGDARIAVLLDDGKLAAPTNVSDTREYYSTKQK